MKKNELKKDFKQITKSDKITSIFLTVLYLTIIAIV